MRPWRTIAVGIVSAIAVLGVGESADAHRPPANTQWVQTWNAGWQAYQTLEAIPLADRGYVSASQDLSIVINAKLDDVFEIYADVNNALGLHPFLTEVIPVRHSERRDIETNDFVALENIPLPDGTIFAGETITRQVINEDEHYYEVDTYDAPGIVTHQRVTFTRIDRNRTRVVEHLTFEAPPEFIDLTVQGGVFAHLLVQQGLKAGIESGALHD